MSQEDEYDNTSQSDLLWKKIRCDTRQGIVGSSCRSKYAAPNLQDKINIAEQKA